MEIALTLGIINTVISMIACPIIASYKGVVLVVGFLVDCFLGY